MGGWGQEGQGQGGYKRKERLGEGQKLVAEMELGVCDGNWLAGHQTQFVVLGTQPDYISQPPLQLVGHVTEFWPVECVDMCTTSRPDPLKLHAPLCSVIPPPA